MTVSENCNTEVTLEIQENLNLAEAFDSLRKCEQMTHLVIQISENKKGWVVFSNIQGVTDSQSAYSYHSSISELPKELGTLVQLTSLDISYLGITTLPESIAMLVNLKSLNMGFNNIIIENETANLDKLLNLEILKIYGCVFNENDLARLKQNKPNLKIYYSERDLIQEIKEKTKQKK